MFQLTIFDINQKYRSLVVGVDDGKVVTDEGFSAGMAYKTASIREHVTVTMSGGVTTSLPNFFTICRLW